MFYEHLWWLFANQDFTKLNGDTAFLLGKGLGLFMELSDKRREFLTSIYEAYELGQSWQANTDR